MTSRLIQDRSALTYDDRRAPVICRCGRSVSFGPCDHPVICPFERTPKPHRLFAQPDSEACE